MYPLLLSISMRTYTTAMLCFTVFFLFADQNLLAPNLSQIAKDFGFSDAERDEKLGGYIAFGFFIVGGPVAILVGYCTDIMNRCLLFGIVVVFGESACLGTYFVQTYPQLFLCRVLTGISIGGATPIIFSLLGDLYPGESRVYVSTLVGIAMSSGIGVGQLISGIIGPAYGWRVPFLIVAIPALLCGLIVFFTVKEPIRGDQEQEVINMRRQTQLACIEQQVTCQHQEGSSDIDIKQNPSDEVNTVSPQSVTTSSPMNRLQDFIALESITSTTSEPESIEYSVANNNDYNEKIECAKIKRLFTTKSAVLIYLQGIPGCLPWGMIYVFLNDYFSEDRGLSIQLATLALTCFGIGGILGQLLGGWIGQKLYNIYPPYQCILMGSSTIFAVIPMLYLLNTKDLKYFGFYVMAFMAGFTISVNGPNVRVVLQNVCIPEIRGTAFAIFTLTDDIGKGLGPAIVVVFIKMCNGNRREAFNIVVLFWLFCGGLLLILSGTVIDDENIVQQTIKESLNNDNPTHQYNNTTINEGLYTCNEDLVYLNNINRNIATSNSIENTSSNYTCANNNNAKEETKACSKYYESIIVKS